jgi:hypothetical protein
VHVDGKIFRTVRALLFEPGRLTEEYWSGHVVSWLRPIRIFLIAAAIHLFFATGLGPFNLRMLVGVDDTGRRHMIVSDDPERNAARGHIRPLQEPERHEIEEGFSHVYNQLRYTGPLWLAGFLWLRFRRRQPFFVNHLILALHLYSFFYVLAVISGELRHISPWLGLVGLSALIYVPLAMRRLFLGGYVRAVFNTLYLLAMMMFIEVGLAAVGIVRSGLIIG